MTVNVTRPESHSRWDALWCLRRTPCGGNLPFLKAIKTFSLSSTTQRTMCPLWGRRTTLIPQVAMMRCFVFIFMARTSRITEPVGSVRSPYWVPCIRLVGPRLRGSGAAACPVSALWLSLVWHPSADSLWPCPSCLSCRPWVTPF
jgi:hypothetical protein